MQKYQTNEIFYIPEGTKIINENKAWLNGVAKENIKKIVLPASTRKIGVKGLADFPNVEEIVLNDELSTIENYAFSFCPKLKKIYIPNSIEYVAEGVFRGCNSLEEITIDENFFYSDKGCNCVFDKANSIVVAGCKNTILPENTKIIGNRAFAEIFTLQEIHIPKNVIKICDSAFWRCTNLKEKSIHYSTSVGHLNQFLLNDADIYYGDQVLRVDNIVHYANGRNGLALETMDGNFYFANTHLDLTCISKAEFDSVATSRNELNRIKLEEVYKLYEWLEYDDIPHYIVVEKMPIAEIPNFYLNNNRKNWQKIISQIRDKSDIAIDTAFTLAHALGVFSADGKESKVATDYIINNLFKQYKIDTLHSVVGDFNRDNKYNAEFAKFFMRYFNSTDFLDYNIPATDEYISLIGACYNNFSQIQKIYPEKRVITRQRNECLTPELIINVLTHKQYNNVDERATELAKKVGLYGYSQYQFDKLQEWYLQGLKEKCVFSHLQDDAHPVQFEVLEKSDPLGAVIGTITNCCQVAGGVGSRCVEYGMSQPNSTFIAFRAGNRIIGQAWIWYDKKNKQITLDNIEVPYSALEDIYDGIIKEKDITLCLKRLAQALKQDFENNGHPLECVTIGLGHNDFKDILLKNFEGIKNPQLLSGYGFYTDANFQVALLGNPNIKENTATSIER